MPSDNNLKAKTAMSTILLIIVAICAMSCKECPTEQPDYDIYLTVEDIFCTSVVLNVTLPDSGDVSAFALDRDDSTVATYTCHDDDTLIIDEGLTPDTDYICRVRFLKNGKTMSESDLISVHTMDTTSHEFAWEINTLGNYSSILRDVWIVNENNIWVVGNIETDSGTYNAAKWDGDKWNLMCIVNADPKFGIYYFDENDIWMISYGYPVHYDGSSWTLYRFHEMGIDASALALWGKSSSNMYFVGLNGSIVHYDGSTFTKMESGTDVDLVDIDGNQDGSRVFVSGYNYTGELSGQSVVLELKDGNWERLLSSTGYFGDIANGDYGRYMAIRVFGNTAYLTTGATDLLMFNCKTRQLRYLPKNSTVMGGKQLESMDGNDFNDMLFVSPLDLVFHYNGSTYYQDDYIDKTFSHELYYLKIRLKGDIAAVFGTTTVSGFIAIGHR